MAKPATIIGFHLQGALAELIDIRDVAKDDISDRDILDLRALVSECLAELSIIKLALSNRPPVAMQTDRMDLTVKE